MLMWILVIVGVVILLGIGFSNWFFDNYSWILFLGFVGALIYYYFQKLLTLFKLLVYMQLFLAFYPLDCFFNIKSKKMNI